MLADAVAVAGGRRTASRAVVTTDGEQPVLAFDVLLAQDLGGDGQVAVGVEQVAGLGVALRVVAEIDLAESRVDAGCRCAPKCLAQPGAGLGAGGVALRCAGDVECPRPGHQTATHAGAALLQRHGVQDGRGNAGALRGDLIGRRRNFPCPDGAGQRTGQQREHGAARHYGCRCHWPPT